jgi:DNA-directed RNA polymerase subunit RPC12/RpoP
MDMGYNTDTVGPTPEIRCPYCGSTDTELFSLFGQQLLTVQYYCNSCHTPFERVKDDDVLEDYAAYKARKEGQQ